MSTLFFPGDEPYDPESEEDDLEELQGGQGGGQPCGRCIDAA